MPLFTVSSLKGLHQPRWKDCIRMWNIDIQWEINKNSDFVLSCFDSERNKTKMAQGRIHLTVLQMLGHDELSPVQVLETFLSLSWTPVYLTLYCGIPASEFVNKICFYLRQLVYVLDWKPIKQKWNQSSKATFPFSAREWIGLRQLVVLWPGSLWEKFVALSEDMTTETPQSHIRRGKK